MTARRIVLWIVVAIVLFVMLLLYLGSQTLQPARSSGASQPTLLL